MGKKKKFKTSHREEKKGEFENPRNESLVFQRGYPNHAWTLIVIVKVFNFHKREKKDHLHFMNLYTWFSI
jgi:hypothetical protein